MIPKVFFGFSSFSSTSPNVTKSVQTPKTNVRNCFNDYLSSRSPYDEQSKASSQGCFFLFSFQFLFPFSKGFHSKMKRFSRGFPRIMLPS